MGAVTTGKAHKTRLKYHGRSFCFLCEEAYFFFLNRETVHGVSLYNDSMIQQPASLKPSLPSAVCCPMSSYDRDFPIGDMLTAWQPKQDGD